MDYRLEQFRFELREDPSSRIFFKLGEHLRREGEFQEAIAVLGNGLEQHPKYVAAWVSLGRALLDAGSSRQAADALGRALALDPENAVASRFAGEAAIANGEWVEAIKALKRARALSAPDEGLEERIAFVEGHLAELGQLESPAPAAKLGSGWVAPPSPGRSLDQVFADADFERSQGSNDGDVFVVEAVEETASEELDLGDAGRRTVAVPLDDLPIPPAPDPFPAEERFEPEPVQTFEGLDEIEAEPGIETGDAFVERAADAIAFDVDDEAPGVSEPPSSFEPEPAFEIGEGPSADDDSAVELDVPSALESATVPISAPVADGPADADYDIDFDLLDDAEFDARSEELPLPTMTLARLALDQADLELAEKTLRGVLERDPSNSEAARLLAGLTAGAEVDVATGPVDEGTVDARARALRRWLEAVRLASERLKP